ncbi:hypothetical protein J4H63_15025 [Vibrio alginolyticus]|uniref:hypothetical protein n=1 Tax=Vibrio alginolyticus TaxID=663 RepID=UPI001BD2919B|nr:hypothetical protein [Vibrio alginolyticus]MBS9970735.1 hypothetical protein [Vibrio alginolyticus]
MTEFVKTGFELFKAYFPSAAVLSVEASTGVLPAFVGGSATLLTNVRGNVLYDYQNKPLSPREKLRTSSVYVDAHLKIANRLESGDLVRDDDFFRQRLGQRSSAEQCLDATIMKAAGQYEEIKLPLFSELYVSACFDADISPELLAIYYSQLEQLNYIQLLVLYTLSIEKNRLEWKWNSEDFNDVVYTLLKELQSRNLINDSFWGDSPIILNPLTERFIDAIGFRYIADNEHDVCLQLKSSGKYI